MKRPRLIVGILMIVGLSAQCGSTHIATTVGPEPVVVVNQSQDG